MSERVVHVVLRSTSSVLLLLKITLSFHIVLHSTFLVVGTVSAFNVFFKLVEV